MLSQGPPCVLGQCRQRGKESKTGVERNQWGENDKQRKQNTLCVAQSDKKFSYSLSCPKENPPPKIIFTVFES